VANIIKNIQLAISALLLVCLIGCGKGCRFNKLKIDVSEIKADLRLERFEQDLFRCKEPGDIQKLYEKYQDFYFIFTQGIMGFRPGADSLNTEAMLEFVKHPRIKYLYDTAQTIFGDMGTYKAGLTDMLKHYRYYFRSDSLPQFVTFISEFGAPSYYDQKYIGIGLDLYFGKDFIYYQAPELEFPQFKIRHFSKEYLVRDAAEALIRSRLISQEAPPDVFINRAVQEGKMLYLLDAFCPEMEDSIKIKYSASQLDWMKNVEKEMWVDLVNRKVLYSTSRFENDRYFNDGPFTSAPNVSQDSPPRVGAWLGWQIIRKYMDSHPNTTLEQLVKENDGEKIFKESGYRPK
jgi:hypothetical protein